MDYTRHLRESAAGHGESLTTVAAGLLPTPNARDGKGAWSSGDGVDVSDAVADLLPTPSTSNRDGNTVNNRGEPLLPGVAEALLPTPSVAIADGGQVTRGGDRADEPLLGGIAERIPLLPSPVVTDADEARNSTAGRITSSAVGHEGDTLLDAMTKLGVADPGTVLPTPVTDPTAGNGHARDLSHELALLPTPLTTDEKHGYDADVAQLRSIEHLLPSPNATQNGYDADPDEFEARRAAAAERHGNNGIGLPLGIAARTLPDDGVEDLTADGDTVRWGKYRAAILRAQHAAGRLAPSPTTPDGKGGKRRLAARFVEWMMLLPLGWVTGVPHVTRRDQLKILGNGVVPPQAALAVTVLLDRVADRLAER